MYIPLLWASFYKYFQIIHGPHIRAYIVVSNGKISTIAKRKQNKGIVH